MPENIRPACAACDSCPVARDFIADLTLQVETALFSGDPKRISLARRAVQRARSFVIERFELSTNGELRRDCLATCASLQKLTDRCRP